MKSIVADFWRIILEQCVNIIVMLTNVSEEGKVKIVVMTFNMYLVAN